jgi:hypothetical protein
MQRGDRRPLVALGLVCRLGGDLLLLGLGRKEQGRQLEVELLLDL